MAQQSFLQELLAIFMFYEQSSHSMSDYMRAIILKAIRYLPYIDDNYWSIILRYALTGSLAERLMASESWLFLVGWRDEAVNYDSYLQQVRTLLVNNPTLPTRLKKNYILLIGSSEAESLDALNSIAVESNDQLLVNSFEVGITGETVELLNYEEPPLIRANFYSGRRENDVDYDYPT